MPTVHEIRQWRPRSAQSVRHDPGFAFKHDIREALQAPPSQRKAALHQALRKRPAAALAILSKPTLKKILLALGFSLAAVTTVMRFPAPPPGGVAVLASNSGQNLTPAARAWYQRAWNAAPTRQQAVNIGGAVATAVNPMWAFKWIAVSVAGRASNALGRQIGEYEQAANRARIQLEYYLSWTMFIAFLAIVSHFIPRLAYNVRQTVHVLTMGSADQAAMMAGRVGTAAIKAKGTSRTRSRSRSRSRSRPVRTLRMGAGRPVPSLPGPAPRPRAMPTNAELLARLS